MTDENARIERLEEELKSLKESYTVTEKKINKAEAWGQAVMWMTLALVGAATKLGDILSWLKAKL